MGPHPHWARSSWGWVGWCGGGRLAAFAARHGYDVAYDGLSVRTDCTACP